MKKFIRTSDNASVDFDKINPTLRFYHNFEAENKPGHSSSQFLSGVSPKAMLKPVITAVCYWGTKPWDGPRSLHEILELKNPKLKAFVPDYPISSLAYLIQ